MRYLAPLVLVGCGTSQTTVEMSAFGVSIGTGSLTLTASIADVGGDYPVPHRLQPMERVVAAIDGQTVELASVGEHPPDSIAGTYTDLVATAPIMGSGGDLVEIVDTSDKTLGVTFTLPDDFELQPMPATTIHDYESVVISWTPQRKDMMQWYVTGDPECINAPYPSPLLDVGSVTLPGDQIGVESNCPVTVVVERYRVGAAGEGIQRRTTATTITVVP
jgi:hypothetical protein